MKGAFLVAGVACWLLAADQVVIRNSGDPDNPPRIATTSLPSGTVGSAYSQTLQLVVGIGRAPFTWTVRVGALPAGLTLGSSTGTISGTPTTAEAPTVSIRVVDSLGGADERSYTLTINAGAGATLCTDAQTAGNAVYIRQGAGGANNGTNWTDALTTPPTTLTRGKTYCVADTVTTFGQWKITAHSASTTVTTIVKATIADHGTSTGWLDAYGDGQAIWSAGVGSEGTFDYNVSGSGYLIIDGGGSPSTCGARAALSGASQTGCGLKFIGTADNGQSFNWHGGGFNSIVRYVELQGPSGTTDDDYILSADHQAYAVWGAAPAGENCTLRYSYAHNSVTIAGAGSGTIFEGNYLANNRINSDAATHGNIVYIGFGVSNVTFRYNYVNNYNAEGFFITWFGGVPSDLFIYGNVFQSPNSDADEYPRGVEIREGAGSAYSNIQVHNNTFVNLNFHGISDRSTESGAGCTGCAATNNLSVNASNSFTAVVSSNNTDDSNTARFVAVGTDFHLTGALAGTTLGATYNTDIMGTVRGVDGVWDRGAYEYTAPAPAPDADAIAGWSRGWRGVR